MPSRNPCRPDDKYKEDPAYCFDTRNRIWVFKDAWYFISSMLKAVKLGWLKRLCVKETLYTHFASSLIGRGEVSSFMKYKCDTKYLVGVPNFYRQLFHFWYEFRAATAEELSFSMTFPWLSMTKNHDFPWQLTSYRPLFSPSRAYFQEVIKDHLNQMGNTFCNFSALRKDEAIEMSLLVCWCIHQHVYTPVFIESIQIQSG